METKFCFRYPVYNPSYRILNAVDDWARDIMTGTDDLELVLQQPFKVAALPIYYNRAGFYTYQPDLVDLDIAAFDFVMFSDAEYFNIDQVRSWIQSLGIHHWALATGGLQENTVLNAEHELYRPYYIRPFLEKNQLPQDTEHHDRAFQFDALLGARRPHRDFVFQALRRSGLLERSIVTYRDCFPGSVDDKRIALQVKRQFAFDPVPWPYVSPNLAPEWEVVDRVNNQISFITPRDIYARTWFSIVCETLYTGADFFLSEKTIKAMYNKRVTVTFGPRNFLLQLQQHGFHIDAETIDISYDNVHQDVERWRQAFYQVMRIGLLDDPKWVLAETRDIREHNHKRLFELEQKRVRDQRDMLIRHIPPKFWNHPGITTI